MKLLRAALAALSLWGIGAMGAAQAQVSQFTYGRLFTMGSPSNLGAQWPQVAIDPAGNGYAMVSGNALNGLDSSSSQGKIFKTDTAGNLIWSRGGIAGTSGQFIGWSRGYMHIFDIYSGRTFNYPRREFYVYEPQLSVVDTAGTVVSTGPLSTSRYKCGTVNTTEQPGAWGAKVGKGGRIAIWGITTQDTFQLDGAPYQVRFGKLDTTYGRDYRDLYTAYLHRRGGDLPAYTHAFRFTEIHAAETDSAGNMYATGVFTDTLYMDGQAIATSPLIDTSLGRYFGRAGTYFLLKLNSAGGFAWLRTSTGPSYNYYTNTQVRPAQPNVATGIQMTVLPSGRELIVNVYFKKRVVIGGTTYQADTSVATYPTESYYTNVVLRYDSAGAVLGHALVHCPPYPSTLEPGLCRMKKLTALSDTTFLASAWYSGLVELFSPGRLDGNSAAINCVVTTRDMKTRERLIAGGPPETGRLLSSVAIDLASGRGVMGGDMYTPGSAAPYYCVIGIGSQVVAYTGGWWATYLAGFKKLPHPPLAVAEDMLSLPIAAYPNPAHGAFYIAGQMQPGQITLYDALGRLKRQDMLARGAAISTADLSPGLYLWRLQRPGSMPAEGRLVVE